MQVTSNIPMVIASYLKKVKEIDNPETVSRAVAVALLPEIRNRIHVEGKNSKGADIGTYDNTYLKLRQSKYNRTGDPSVVISLTRQLENSYSLQATDKAYTIGFTSPGSEEKVKYMEEKYGTIWALTDKEVEVAKITAGDMATKLLNE
jgi:hypothetical protein